MEPLRFILVNIAGWMNREQGKEIEYLRAENRVLRSKIPGKRVRCTQVQRDLLGVRANGIKFSRLNELTNAVTPETLLRWIRGQA